MVNSNRVHIIYRLGVFLRTEVERLHFRLLYSS